MPYHRCIKEFKDIGKDEDQENYKDDDEPRRTSSRYRDDAEFYDSLASS